MIVTNSSFRYDFHSKTYSLFASEKEPWEPELSTNRKSAEVKLLFSICSPFSSQSYESLTEAKNDCIFEWKSNTGFLFEWPSASDCALGIHLFSLSSKMGAIGNWLFLPSCTFIRKLKVTCVRLGEEIPIIICNLWTKLGVVILYLLFCKSMWSTLDNGDNVFLGKDSNFQTNCCVPC